VTGSELLALIEEDRLIKKYRPPYNIRQKQHEKNCWLVLTAGGFPALRTVEDPAAAAGRRAFGPLRDRFFAGELLDVVKVCFGVRSCATAEAENNCLERDVGLCAGPCRGDVTREDYAAAVANAAAFLDGEPSAAVRALEAAMERSATALDFEKASRVRDQIRTVRNFCRRQRFIRHFREGCLAVRERGEYGSAGLTHLFVHGAHSVRAGRLADDEAAAAARKILASGLAAEDARRVTDRAHIVFGWLKRRGNKADHSFLFR
jgi:excinuclease UvrABC nuclease subunit